MSSMAELARKRQAAWDNFIQKRTKTEAQYNELIEKESNSPYEPMRVYVQTLPKTLAEIIPCFYVPMEQQLEYPEQCDEQIARYNAIVDKVNSITEEMLIMAEKESEQFQEVVKLGGI